MKYDFTTIMDRHGKDSIAVDFPPGQAKEGYDVIPYVGSRHEFSYMSDNSGSCD